MDMIERVAKALHDALAVSGPDDGHKRYWETAPRPVKEMMLRLAGSALEAAYEPTEAMILAGDNVAPDDIFAHEKASRLRYQAMITEALKDT